ncbi:MATE family efflux transporter [Candidatus Aminicenantes bacterium AC-334-K16]|jgi:putative MATE family efflux protein|nr:MATE family efflux transporter [Candidatus Aminicenantes bacterium AC-334-K16]
MEEKDVSLPEGILRPTPGVQTLLGKPRQAIIKLSGPMIVAMSVQTLYNFVDAFWVSGLGPDALSAVGFFFPFFFMLMALATGLGVGGSAAVSRRIGARDKAGADSVASHTIVMMFILTVLIMIPFFWLIPHIFSFMGAGAITPTATHYARILFAFTLVIFFANIASALLRGEGDVKRAMYAMMLGAGLNIVLDPIFIFALKLGVAGAAWATALSLLVSAWFLFNWLILKKDSYVQIRLRAFRFKKRVVYDILRVGLPTSIQQLSMALAVFLFNLIVVKVGGTDGVAVLTTGWRVTMFAILPLIGMAMGVTAVTGAAYGGRDYRKLNEAYLYAIKIGVLVEVIIAGLTFFLAPYIAALFTLTPEGLRIRSDLVVFLQTMCLYYPTTSLGMLSSAMFQGTGKGLYSLTVTIIRTIILAAPIAYFLAVLVMKNLVGVWWGVVIGNILGSLIAFLWGRHFVHSLFRKAGVGDKA